MQKVYMFNKQLFLLKFHIYGKTSKKIVRGEGYMFHSI